MYMYFAFLINVIDQPLLLRNVCVKKCATTLYLNSIQSSHEVKFQYSKNDKMSLKEFQVVWQPCDLATLELSSDLANLCLVKCCESTI